MKRIGLVLAVLALSGCASMTPRERAVVIGVSAAVVAGAIVASQPHHHRPKNSAPHWTAIKVIL